MSNYKIFIKDACYPWDIANHPEGPWHIVNTLKEFSEYIIYFGIPAAISYAGVCLATTVRKI